MPLIRSTGSSDRDENGNERGGFGLEKVFGARLVSPARGPVRNTYVALNGTHPINRGYDGAKRIMGGTKLIGVETLDGAEEPFLFVPDFPDLPMEVYLREEPRGGAVIARQTEGGRTVYIPWNVGGIFWEVLAADHGRLIVNAVKWALGDAARVEVSGRSVLDVALRENERSGLSLVCRNPRLSWIRAPEAPSLASAASPTGPRARHSDWDFPGACAGG